jgi:YD repeat-containing protein
MWRYARIVVGMVIAILLAITPTARSQTVQYAYDAAGRLSVVGDARGDVAVYDYDAVGNLLSIRRVAVAGVPQPVVIGLVTPGAVRRGSTISIFGKGFAATPVGNSVTVNGAPAQVLTAAPTRLTVMVPLDATTGPVRLTAPLGTAASPQPLRILGALSITPPTAVVAPGGSIRLAAVGEGLGAVRWSVDGFAGGDAQRGTITSDGLYTAPSAPRSSRVRITATSLDDVAIEASAEVSLMAPRPLFVVARSSVSVGVARAATFAMAAPLTLRVAPVVTSVTPSSAVRGETVRVTAAGAGLDGATRLEFLAGAEADPALVVTGLALAPDGSEATADVTITASAVVGPRTVRLVTPSGTSGDAALGDNVFTVR